MVFIYGKYYSMVERNLIPRDAIVEVLFYNSQTRKYEIKGGKIRLGEFGVEFWEGWYDDDRLFEEEDKYLLMVLTLKGQDEKQKSKEFKFIMGTNQTEASKKGGVEYGTPSYPQLLMNYLNGLKEVIIVGLAKNEDGMVENLIFKSVDNMNEKGFYADGYFWSIK